MFSAPERAPNQEADMRDRDFDARRIELTWEREERWNGIRRPYAAEDVLRLRNSFPVRYSLAERGAGRPRDLPGTEDRLAALGALTGNQAMQQVKAGLKAIYLSGWQVE